jgi:membrane-associated phospholipid phosphatase
MDRRFLLGVAIVAALLTAAGLVGLDRVLAEWLHSSSFEEARFFSWGLIALDTVTGMRVWIWLLGCVALAVGLVELWRRRASRIGYAFVIAALVQFATIATMILGKDFFGRLRPHEVLASGDWSRLWFVGGGSFPSGHSAFYFGLMLPLAAACPIRWARVLLIAVPLFVVLARIDLAKHFVSDVSASALIAALYALIAATLARRWRAAPSSA